MSIEELKNLWDGSEPGWALHKRLYDTWHLVFHFSSEGPNAKQITLLRQFVPELMSSTLPTVHELLKGKPCYRTCEHYGNIEGHRLRSQAKDLGLLVSAEVTNQVSYLPIRDGLIVTIIEDNDLANAVALKMIEAGVPVFETYID